MGEHYYTMQMLTFCHFFFAPIKTTHLKRAEKCAFVSSMFQVLLLPLYNAVAIESSRWGVARFSFEYFSNCLNIFKNFLSDPKNKKKECPHCRKPLTRDRLVQCRWMNEVTASLAQLGVTSVREATLPVGPDGDSGESSDMCSEHPNQVKDVFCLNCQMAICSQVRDL